MSTTERGLTFVELLIAATMMSILFIGLGTHLRGGINVWQRTTATVEALQRQRVAMDRLERDVANAFLYESRPEAYGTDPGQLPTPPFRGTLGGAPQWVTLERLPQQRVPGVRMVTYTCEEVEGRRGLWRMSQSVGEVQAAQPPIPELLLDGCDGLSFRYAFRPSDHASGASLEWSDQWNDVTQLPRLIEVSLRIRGRDMRRFFTIPSGVLKPIEGGPPSPS
jgi:type II secretory pathway pseudopilin PulG